MAKSRGAVGSAIRLDGAFGSEPQFLQTMIYQQQGYIASLLEKQKTLLAENEKLKSKVTVNQGKSSLGYQMFVQSLKAELVRRDPSVSSN